MADVRARQRTTYSGVVSSTPSDTNTVVATASAPNISNTSCSTRLKDDTSMNAYARPHKVALPPLPNDKAEHEEADDGFMLQPVQMKWQRRQRRIDAET